jgi:hypothetical protein
MSSKYSCNGPSSLVNRSVSWDTWVIAWAIRLDGERELFGAFTSKLNNCTFLS